MGQPHLVVDGSNIATEGRSMPSLQQLLDAVDAISAEFDFDNTTVIVDSTFAHRIDKSEKDAYEDKVNSAQIITPPAGVIGRGDAFILEVADRADAVVLSNDSFQEFHGKYDWLFQEGRLLGAKHVPGVGWIFLARSPVRGPTSRKAVSDAKRKRRGSKQAATKAPAKKSRGSSKKQASSKPTKKAASGDRAPRKSGGKEPEPYNEPLPFIEFVGAHPTGSIVDGEIEQFSSHGAYVMVDGTRCYIALKSISDPPPRSAKEVLTLGETRAFVVQAIDTPRRGIDLGIPEGEVLTPVERPDDDPETTTESGTSGRGSRRRGRSQTPREDAAAPAARAPKTEATPSPSEPAAATPADAPPGDKKLSVSQRRKLRAQQAAADASTEPADDTSGETMAKKAAKKAPAKKRPAKKAAKKTTARKAPAKKSPAKKSPAKKTTARKAPAKKAAAKKTTARKAPAKKAAAKKTTARKAPAKKAPARKAPARKTAAKKTAAKKTGAKKAPAKTTTARKSAKKAPAKRAPRKR